MLLVLIAILLVNLTGAYDLIARLDYGTFQGAVSAEYNVSYWQKIPYAAPPVGVNRFRAPQPPSPVSPGTVFNSSQSFDMCPQRTVNGSEDCLYLGLYGRPWRKGQGLRPVVVAFYGGGFIQGSAAFAMPPPAYPILNVSAASDMIFVYPNYRVNAFGFLSGREVAQDPDSDANAGLLDQQMALQWVRKYIHHFGGDPHRVTAWGQSAGGGSVLAQAAGPRHRRPLFQRALAASPFWPKTYRHDSPEAQARYDMLANLTGCAGPASLPCLKAADVQAIRDASLAIASSHTYDTSSYSWGPVVDGAFLRRPLSEAAFRPGAMNMQVGFATYNSHEGETFIPPYLKSVPGNSSVSPLRKWLAGYLPTFSETDLQRVEMMYPQAGNVESPNDTYFRAGMIYRDSVLSCPALWMAGAAPNGGWLGEYTIPPAKHASDVYWWNTVNPAQKTDSFHYEGYAGALASFFMTGDPNALKLTGKDVAGVPALASGNKFVIDDDGFSIAAVAQLPERCQFWRQMGPKIPI